MGVEDAIFNVIANFLSCRLQMVVFHGEHSKDVEMVFGVHQSSVVSPLLFSQYTSDLPIILENTLLGYADYSTLIAKVSKPSNIVSVVSFLKNNLAIIGDWCKRWGRVVNHIITKALVI